MQDSRSTPQYRPRPPRPTPEDIAETLTAPDEYLWAVRRKTAWKVAVILLVFAVLGSLAAVGYIGGRQVYVFGGLGGIETPAIRKYFDDHYRTGITLANSAPAVPEGWAGKLLTNAVKCWQVPKCRAVRTGTQWTLWRTSAGKWFPELAWAVMALQASAGAFLMALGVYLFAWADVNDWKSWEQRERLAAGKVQRDRQRRGG